MTPITDGLAYNDAYKKELWTLKGPRTEHVRHIKLKGDRNNNKMERLDGEIRDREKVMRGLDHGDFAQTMIDGVRIYYNFIRPHIALKGETPAEKANISQKLGQNKWLSLIKKSASDVMN